MITTPGLFSVAVFRIEVTQHLGYKFSISKSPNTCYEHSGFITPWTPGDEPEPKNSEDELQVGTSDKEVKDSIELPRHIKIEDGRREIPCFSKTGFDYIFYCVSLATALYLPL